MWFFYLIWVFCLILQGWSKGARRAAVDSGSSEEESDSMLSHVIGIIQLHAGIRLIDVPISLLDVKQGWFLISRGCQHSFSWPSSTVFKASNGRSSHSRASISQTSPSDSFLSFPSKKRFSFYGLIWLEWVHLDNSRQYPYFRSIILITSTKPLLPCHILTLSQVLGIKEWISLEDHYSASRWPNSAGVSLIQGPRK